MSRVQEIVAEVLSCDIGSLPAPSTALTELDDWDSLKHVMLVLALEQNFGVNLEAEEIKSMVTIEDIDRLLKQKGVND